MAQRGLEPEETRRKPRVTSWGELLWDLFPHAAHLGGSAANVAYHAAQAGAESWLISAVGQDDLGRRAVEQLSASGVITTGISTNPHAPTGSVRVTFADGEPQFAVQEGVAWDRIVPDQTSLAAIHSSDVFCFSTLAQRTPLMRSRLRSVLEEIHQKGSACSFGGAPSRRPTCILDLNLRPPFDDPETILEALAYADVVKLNEAEAQWLEELVGAASAIDWILNQYSVRLIALTRAEKGATFFTRTLRLAAPGLPQSSGDPVGAGDAFVAAMAVALGQGASLPRVLERANRHGALVAGSFGAMPTLSQRL